LNISDTAKKLRKRSNTHKKFIFRFSWCFPEGKKEGRKGGEEGSEGGRDGKGRKGRLHVRIMNDVLSENDPFRAQVQRSDFRDSAKVKRLRQIGAEMV